MNRLQKSQRWARYFYHVRKTAMLGRAWHGAKRKAVGLWPSLIAPRSVTTPFALVRLRDFSQIWRATGERFEDLEGLDEGIFTVKGVSKDFGSIEAMAWNDPFKDNPQFSNWLYDFSFFHYASVLVQRDAKWGVSLVARMLAALEAHHPVAGGKIPFVWSPISTAVRTLNLVAAGRMARDSGLPGDDERLLAIAAHIAKCVAVLRFFSERYVGYNHALFGNVALLCGELAVHAGDRAGRLADQSIDIVDAQILSDGLQAERTGTYHIHVLLLAQALKSLGHASGAKAARLDALLDKMANALDVLVHPDGETALFNDCAIADAVPPEKVGWKPRPNDGRISHLAEAGFTKASVPRATVIFDTGKLGPDDVIGHGHADFLAVELSIDGVRAVTDPGVFSYSAGPLRDHTRSASSHNGPGYAGLEPAEFFGAWRVGRRGCAHRFDDRQLPGARPFEAAGWCDGYDRYGGRTMRYIGLDFHGTLLIVDAWRAGPGLTPALSLLCPDEWTIEANGGHGASLRHVNGATATMWTSSTLRLNAQAGWRPKGAMVDATATELSFEDFGPIKGNVHLNLLAISPGHRSALPADAYSVASMVMSLAGSTIGLFNEESHCPSCQGISP